MAPKRFSIHFSVQLSALSTEMRSLFANRTGCFNVQYEVMRIGRRVTVMRQLFADYYALFPHEEGRDTENTQRLKPEDKLANS